MKRIYITLLLSCVGFIGEAQTVNFTPSKDNSIHSASINSSNGLGALYSGMTCGGDRRRAFLEFDVSSIPPGAVVNSVTLTVNLSSTSAGGTGGADAYKLWPVLAEFGEGTSFSPNGTPVNAQVPDVTWQYSQFFSTLWTTPGGDFSPLSVASSLIGTTLGNYTFTSTAGFVALVQSWVDNPTINFGFAMRGNETVTCTARQFGSKEVGTAPILTVNYTVGCPGPTAVCQDVNVFIDGAGSASIVASDLNGGSTDDCGTGSLSYSASQTTFNCAQATQSELMVTGVFDGPLPGGLPKGIELYVAGDIPDLSAFGVGSANNGGGTNGQEFTFPAVSAANGTFIYVTSDSASFHNFFGYAPDYESSSVVINGDDAIEVFHNGSVSDVFGDINVDGTGQPWDYLDSWGYRKNFQQANGGVFLVSDWIFPGPDGLEGGITNATCLSPFMDGNYTHGPLGVAVTLTVTDGLGNTDDCVAYVNVQDTINPIPSLNSLPSINSTCVISSLTAPTALDNCVGTITGVQNQVLPLTASTVLTWKYDDGNGNLVTQTQNVTINNTFAPVPNTPVLPPLNASCSLAAPTFPTATDDCAGVVTGVPNVTFPLTASALITWTYTDGINTSTQTQNATVTNTPPVPAITSLPTLNGSCSIPAPTFPTATDDCVSGVITGVPNVTFPLTSSALITWTYTDGVNTVTQNQNAVIADLIPPVANTGTLPALNGSCSITAPTPPTATDNCSGQITGVPNVTFPLTTSAVITWTYTDGAGNAATQTQNATVADVIAPVANAAALPDLTDDCLVLAPTAPTATDNCSGAITGTTSTTFPISTPGTTVVTWTYTDGSGNSTTQNQNVIVGNGIDVTTTLVAETVTANAAGLTYQWIDCSDDDEILGATGQSYTATTTGDYAVIITSGNCIDTSDCVNVQVGGLDDLSIQFGMTVAPNPSKGIFNVSFLQIVEGELSVIDYKGSRVSTAVLKDDEVQVNLTNYEAGIYFIQITTEEGILRARVVKN